MANQLANNPFTLDTVSATPVLTGWLALLHAEFSEYALDTDTAVLKDALGNVIWAANGSSDLQTVRSGNLGSVKGLALTTLTAGKVRVYFK